MATKAIAPTLAASSTPKASLPAGHGILLQWQDTANPPGTTYNVNRGIGGGNEAPLAGAQGLTDLFFLDSNGVTGTDYYYTVQAVVNGNISPASNEANVDFPPLADAPTNLTATAQ